MLFICLFHAYFTTYPVHFSNYPLLKHQFAFCAHKTDLKSKLSVWFISLLISCYMLLLYVIDMVVAEDVSRIVFSCVGVNSKKLSIMNANVGLFMLRN